MRKLKLFFTALAVLVASAAFAQNVTVSGVVKDAVSGDPIPFASIQLKGTMEGGNSDADGNYRISVPENGTLVFSSIGYHVAEVYVRNMTVINVLLEPDTQMLDETIVVAFGTQTKASFTGAATVVNSEELAKHVTTNVVNALVGSTPGLQIRGGSGAPGAGSGSVSIRGITSMYAITDPLVIVDGAPYSASLSNIPQEDIESVTVLKDAASAALYGARGAAGVILVTTKSGKKGKAQVSLDTRWGFNSRAIQEYETVNDPGKYYETMYEQYKNYYFYGQGMGIEDANANANNMMLQHLGYNIYNVPENEFLVGTNGKLNPHATLGRKYEANGETYYLTNDNWRDAAYSNAMRQEYTVSINGSSSRGNFYASLGYLDEDGIIEYSGYKRFSARLKSDYQVTKWMKFGANVAYTNSETKSNPNMSTDLGSTNMMFFTSRIAPIYPIYVRVLDANGNPQIRTDEHGNPQYDFGVGATNYPGLGRAFMQTGNPLGANRYNDSTSGGNKFSGTFNVDVDITKFLKFNATSTLDWGHTNVSFYETGLYGPKVSVNGEITKQQSDSYRQNHVQTLTYYDKFGEHDVKVLAGHEYYHTKTTYLGAKAQGLFSPSIQEINAAAKPMDSSSYTSAYNVEGYFASAQYSYADKYFASASFRRDASSYFAKENRWGNFWSVGAAWLINEERFFNVSWIDQLKLKYSIGQQGNDNLNTSWAYVDLYTLTPSSDVNMSTSYAQMGNPDITWETTTNMNAGVEFSLFGSRLNGSVDVYNKKTSDLLFWVSIPESAGTRGYYDNIGDIRNYGVELSLQGSVVRTTNVDWNIHFNTAHNKSRILSLPETKIADLGGFNEDSMWYKVGGPLYNAFRPEYAGVNDLGQATYYIDTDLNGSTNRPGNKRDGVTTDPNVATKYEQGTTLPVAYGGFGTSLYAYGFDFSVTFDYQLGGKIYDSQYAALMSNNADAASAGNAVHVDILKSWSPNNTSSTIPRFQYGDQYTTAASNRWLTDASYLNFQSFTVGYTIPRKITSKINIEKIRIYASGENLCFWSARQGLDPRYAYDANASINVYSPVRTIMGGLQLTF